MQAFDGTRYQDLPDQAAGVKAASSGRARAIRTQAQAKQKRTSGFDLSLGPAYNKENRKLREERLATTDEQILYQRKLRQSLARQASASKALKLARPSRTATSTAGRMVVSGSRQVQSAPKKRTH